jgi:hypothetical protein
MRGKGSVRRGARLALMAAVTVLGVVLLAGCGGSKTSLGSAAQQLMQEYPWLGPLGLNLVESLLAQYGSNIIGLLVAAAAALLG